MTMKVFTIKMKHLSGSVYHLSKWYHTLLVDFPWSFITLHWKSCNIPKREFKWSSMTADWTRQRANWCQLFTYGAGGTFALYSLLCRGRHARLSTLPNQQATDQKLSTYATDGSADAWQSSGLKALFEKNQRFRNVLFIFVLLGTWMAIGDGVLTIG